MGHSLKPVTQVDQDVLGRGQKSCTTKTSGELLRRGLRGLSEVCKFKAFRPPLTSSSGLMRGLPAEFLTQLHYIELSSML